MPSGEDLEVALQSKGLGSPGAASASASKGLTALRSQADDLHDVKGDQELLSRIKTLITLRKYA